VASLEEFRIYKEFAPGQGASRRALHTAQVGDISTLHIRVTFQLGVYTSYSKLLTFTASGHSLSPFLTND
ncbi:MAG TPA: hypothetical protein VKC61_05225, partial [Pyrinomonadaceae bacterium]|nr:hypothetical protein [Pyrinomonadaceae bacterium]